MEASNNRRTWPWWALGGTLVLLLAVAGLQLSRATDRLPALELGVLEDPARRVVLAELAGQARVINFWASWCLPCRIEHPQVEALARRYPGAVVGVNYQDTREEAGKWLAYFGNPFSLVLSDPTGAAGAAVGLPGVPFTLLLDAQGNVIYRHTGAISADQLERLILPRLAQ